MRSIGATTSGRTTQTARSNGDGQCTNERKCDLGNRKS